MTAKQTKSRLARILNYLDKATKLSNALNLRDSTGTEVGHNLTVISSELRTQHDKIAVVPVKKRAKANATTTSE